MPALKSILSWFVMTAAFLLFALMGGKKPKTQNITVAAVGSALLILLTMASPPTTAPFSFWPAFSRWLHNFIFFTLLLNFIRQSSRKRSAMSGLAFATSLALLELLA